jgi:hypothetical protein
VILEKVHYDSKAVWLREGQRRKHKQWKFEILHVSKGSCMVSVMMTLMLCEECRSLFVEEAVSYNGSCAPK